MQKQQLTALLKDADTMTQDLIQLRNAVSKGTVSSLFQSPSDVIVKATEHRSLLRQLAETLKANRSLVQINKQKIEKSRIVLEGLDYFKKTLKDKIQGYHTDVESIDEYVEEPIGEIDWELNYEEGESKLRASLDKLRAKDLAYKATLDTTKSLQKNLEQKKKLYNHVLPKHVKNLCEQVIETTKLFGIEANQNMQKIDCQQLAYIYGTFKTLKVAQKIIIEYGKGQHEYIDLIIKPSGLDVYETVQNYRIVIEEKEIKIRIAYLFPEFSNLVIGIDRRSGFSNKEIFHRLINQEEAKPVFDEPSVQSQRILNDKFVILDWLESVLCASSVETTQFLQIVRQRVFTTALTKYLLQRMKNPEWINSISPIIHTDLSLKRLIIESQQKISFQEYKQLVSLPRSLDQSLSSYEEVIQNNKGIQNSIDSHKQIQKRKNKLVKMLFKIGLDEILIPETYSYHKLTINCSKLRVQCVLLLPYSYPQSCPRVKVLNVEKLYEQDMNNFNSLECKTKIETKTTYGKEAELIENETNSFDQSGEYFGIQSFKILHFIRKLLQSITSARAAFDDKKMMS